MVSKFLIHKGQSHLHTVPRITFSQNGKAKGPNGKKAPLTSRANNDHEDQTVEQRYQKKTQLEHILLRPDTYSECPAASVESRFKPCLGFNFEFPPLVSIVF